ncbi:RNA polymerase subunit sigma [Amycolatopsis sp. WAC 01375]|uniref:RNA polymerase sigma factor n=1 Tax=Amycolatopsis sp. WAC 01375 TaxID=2203194 RepID=UPI000F79F309|nr:sigma-70 family RNA polymerase sigma factor [Amycolatopsis sp. WAC 01375]RSM80538.1 RNA polymerase subunit sigma [Amycolatopsis sp. WAC 01375]
MSTIVLPSKRPATALRVQRTAGRRTNPQNHHQAAASVVTPDVPAEERSDADLLQIVRHGDPATSAAAYGALYMRHRASAHHLAGQLACPDHEAHDLVSEAFLRVLDIMQGGDRGPVDARFRAYLLTTLRHIAYDRTRRERRITFTADVETTAIDTGNPGAITEPFQDAALAGLERLLAARAFARLTERHQEVLWHLDVEELTPLQVAPMMGLTPNGVSALAYRARERLRQEYLQAHVPEPDERSQGCLQTAAKLGAWVRGGLQKRDSTRVGHHVSACGVCQAVVTELYQEIPA